MDREGLLPRLAGVLDHALARIVGRVGARRAALIERGNAADKAQIDNVKRLNDLIAATPTGQLEKAREEAIKKLEEESKKPVAERRLPEFGSDKDFQLIQALNQLKGLPVKASTTLAERKVEKKED